MKFAWQQSRSEALYVEQESTRIFGFICWKDDNRLKIEAHAVADKARSQFKPVGTFANELKAKEAVEESVANMYPPELTDEQADEIVGKALTSGRK